MNIIKSTLIGLLFSVFIIIVISFTITFIYEDEISELFIKDLNRRIDAEVSTDRVNLSLLEKFPGASVELENLQLYTTDNSDTTLGFVAQNVYFQFNIADIFTRNVHINKINIQNGSIKILSDRPIRLQKKEVQNKNIELNLNKLTISDFGYFVLNDSKNFQFKGRLNNAVFSGNFTQDKKSLYVDSESFVYFLEINGFPYIQDKNLGLSGNFGVTEESFNLKEGVFQLESLPFEASGKYDRKNNLIDLEFQGNDIRIPELNLYIPWKFRKKYESLQISSGNLDMMATVKGNTKKTFPETEIDFRLSNGMVELKKDKSLQLKDINLSGYFTNGRTNQPETSLLILKNIDTKINDAHLAGEMEVNNFLNPTLKAEGSIESELQELVEMLPSSEISVTKGSIEGNFAFETAINEPVDVLSLIKNKQLNGEVSLKDISFQYQDYFVSKLRGFTYLDQSGLHFDPIQGYVNTSSDISFEGSVYGLAGYLKDSTTPFTIDGDLFSDNLHLDNLKNESDTSSKAQNFKLPQEIKGNLNLSINHLKWNRFYADAIKGKLVYQPGHLSFHKASLHSLDGLSRMNAEIMQKNDGSFVFKTHSYLDHININKAFEVFNNFNQKYMQQENINGFISGDIYFAASLTPDLKVKTQTISNVNDFTIENGELIHFKPMESLSKFINMSELQHIDFSKLTNKITIKNQVVRIPQMDIRSSAMDLSLEGYHYFNGKYQYRVNILLSELLSKKADEKVKEYGTIADDGVGKTRLYLIIEGTKDHSEVRYDKERVKEKIKKDIRNEKKEIKSILKEEFGLFKHDTTLRTGTPENKTEFQIKWDDGNTIQDKKKETRKKKKKKTESEFIIKWEEDTLK
jgi:hypothetical protein